MIRYVELENWKAYRSFRLEVSPGTTFLVAPNGVGKSSFIEALQWVLDCDAKPAAGAMRLRATRSSVDVGLLAGEAPVRIKRILSFPRSGRGRNPTLETQAWINDRPAQPLEVFALLEREWAADNRFATRAAFLMDQFAEARNDPDLRSHLTKLHGLDHVQDAVDRITIRLKAAIDRADNARKAVGVHQAEIRSALSALEDAEGRTAETKAAVSSARDSARRAEANVAAARATNAAFAAYANWRHERDKLAAKLRSLLGTMPEELDLRPTARAAAAAARVQVAELDARHARLEERVATVEAALARLRTAGAECPVCRRPLDDDARRHAEEQHQLDLAASAEELEAVDQNGPRALVPQLAEAATSAERLGDPPAQPSGEAVDLTPLEEDADTARVELERALARAGEARAKEAAARAKLEELEAASSGDDTVALYTKVAALDVAKTALESTITGVLDSQLGPIADDVNRRWEAIFHDRPGLRLDARGRLSRPFDDGQNLDIDAFSTGERVVAKLLLRLAALTATTKVPFCVIDEPLEHLDPDARSYVARTLAYLGMGDGLRQIFVTTYEQQLALQLTAFGKDRVHLEFLRTAHVVD
ncbi:MAG TPA: AAA family ATPase [Acidimicrobiales bacterium]|jgi:DNA repair exonuclease SbcCD ATPase subunit